MFINVVITRVILFCPAVPPSPPSAPSLVPRNATSFVSLLAKLLVLRTLLSLPMRKVERERERARAFPHESARSSSCPLALRPFLSFSSFLSFPHREVPLSVPPTLSYLSPFFSLSRSLSRSLLSRSSRCYRSRVSLLGSHSFSSSPPRRRGASSSSSLRSPSRGSRIPRRPFPFLPLVLLFSRGWLLFHPSSRRSISPLHGHHHRRVAPAASTLLPRHHLPLLATSPFSLVLFCPCRSRCSALFEFKRGSRRCLVSPS